MFDDLPPGIARISETLETADDLKAGTTAKNLLQAKHFATMSALIYDKHHSDKTLDPSAAVEGRDCSFVPIMSNWKQFRIPITAPTRPSDRIGEQALLDSDLVYAIWYRPYPETLGTDYDLQLALVFRGTHKIGDFWSNFRWFTRFMSTGWDQYDLTRTIAKYVEESLLQMVPFRGKKVQVVTAGHSLGGGLAQQAAYASKKIKLVYSFNGSSVTGFYDVAERDQNKVGIRIYRIHEKGEILAVLRGFMSAIYPVSEKNPQITNVTYNFGKGGPVSEHSIDQLACSMITNGDTIASQMGETG